MNLCTSLIYQQLFPFNRYFTFWNMGENEVDFTKPWKHSDVIFKVEDQQIHASKAVLALVSPVFETMFTGGFLEETASEIPLPGKEIETFVALMKVVHYHNWKITSN